MTIAVDLGRKATKPTNNREITMKYGKQKIQRHHNKFTSQHLAVILSDSMSKCYTKKRRHAKHCFNILIQDFAVTV